MPEEVTGMTAFWAVLALALNAMARPSFASKALYDPENTYEGSFIPELSSPVVCLVDCLTELIVLGQVVYKACCKRNTDSLPCQGSSTTAHKAKYDSVAVRTLLFILGGLPQAVKMSGMRGIPITQTLSATFLASTVLGTISELLSERAEVEKKAISAWLRKNHRRVDLLKALVFLAHGIMAAIAWNMVSKKLMLHQDTPGIVLVDICLGIGTITTLLAVLLSVVWILATLLAPMAFARRIKIVVSPIIVGLPFMLLFPYPSKLLKAGENAREGLSNEDTTLVTVLWNTAPLLAIAASGSYILAAGLVRATNILTRASADEHQSSQESGPETQTSAQSAQPPTSDGATNAMNGSLPELEVDPVEDLLKTGTITLLLPLEKYVSTSEEEQDNQVVSQAEVSQQSASVEETVNHRPAQQSPQSTDANAPSSSPTDTSTITPKRGTTASRLKISGTHWNWLLVGYSFWNFRDKIPAALRYQWKSTAGPIRKKFYTCLLLCWQIFKLFAMQSILFGVFVIANIFDFSPVDRLFARIARKVDPGTGRVWFAVFNLVTVFCVYAVAFDGAGTINPGWTGVLGRKG